MTLDILDGTAVARNASVYMVEEAWVSGELQWSNQPDATVPVAENISHNNQTKYVFSCVDAVRHWYEGDPTGMNENYGIMVRYYDETLINYNSIYSADCSYESKRPVIAITYAPPTDEVSVLEGNTKALSVTGATGTITWTSSNTAAATVDANGIVTGIKAGVTTITASVGDTVYQTFTVYVKIANGVYYIENGESLCLGTSGQVANGTPVSLYTKATTGIDQLNQLWKITYLESGYYSIQPMYYLSMALGYTENTVGLYTAGATDTLSSMPNEDTWTIEYDTSGYLFRFSGASSQTMRCSGAYPSASITVAEYSSANASSFRWNTDIVTSVAYQDQTLLLDTQTGDLVTGVTRYIEPGETVTMADLGFAASFVSMYQTDQTITWSAQYPSVAAVDSETGAITPLKAGGTTEIYAKHNYNGYDRVAYFTVYIKPVPNGDYFIRSRAYNKYIQIDSMDSSNNFATSGAIIEQWSYHGEDYQKWSITWRGNGYYSIISAQSGMALSIASGQTNNAEVSLVQETYTGADRQLWKITATNEGRYKIKAKSSEGNAVDLVMTAGHETSNDSNGLNIEQCQYTDDSNYIDEWFVCSIVDVGMSTDNYSGNDDRDLGSYFYANQFYTGLTYPVGVAPFTLTHRYNKDSTYMADKRDFAEDGAISNDIDFMVYIGHGHVAHVPQNAEKPQKPWGNHIQYCNPIEGDTDVTDVCDTKKSDEEKAMYCLYTSEVNFGSSESDLRWVWMYTCNFLNSAEDMSNDDGDDTNNNLFVTNADLIKMMKGAHMVMGYATKATLCNAMASNFSSYLQAGDTLYDAFFKAGHTGETQEASENHYQKIMYIPQARNETIYSPEVHYDYDVSDVRIAKRCIQDVY